MAEPLLDVSQAQLRKKRGMKWTRYPADILPAWVADMDFPVAPAILAAITGMLDTQDLGYPRHDASQRVFDAFAHWMRTRHGWQVDTANMLACDDVVQMLHACVLMFSEPGEGVVIQTPIYPPFMAAVSQNGRRMVENRLAPGAHQWELDFAELQAAIDSGTRILMLCNPHNPTGRVFSAGELDRLTEIVCAHDLIVIADEIHMDLVFAPHRHIPFASRNPEIAARTITLTSASKAFNVAGLHCAVAHFGSADLRARFNQLQPRLLGGPSALSMAATEAAWRECAPWLDAAMAQLDTNRRTVASFVTNELPGVRHYPPQATYLAWLDCSELKLPVPASKFFLDEAKVGLSPGGDFSSFTQDHARLNFATSPQILDEILSRMASAVKGR